MRFAVFEYTSELVYSVKAVIDFRSIYIKKISNFKK